MKSQSRGGEERLWRQVKIMASLTFAKFCIFLTLKALQPKRRADMIFTLGCFSRIQVQFLLSSQIWYSRKNKGSNHKLTFLVNQSVCGFVKLFSLGQDSFLLKFVAFCLRKELKIMFHKQKQNRDKCIFFFV